MPSSRPPRRLRSARASRSTSGACWLRADGGQSRLSIVSIAHLGDAERVFVVATLLTRVKAWMRSLPGSPALRALVYVDEIFGFFPPSAEPPTKSRSSRFSSRLARSAWGWSSRPRTPSTSTTAASRTAAAGGWVRFRPSATGAPLRGPRGSRRQGRLGAPRQDAKARLPPERRAPKGARARRDALGDELSPRADDEGRPREAEGRRRPAEGGRRRPRPAGSAPPAAARRLAGAMAREAERRHRVRGALREVCRALQAGRAVARDARRRSSSPSRRPAAEVLEGEAPDAAADALPRQARPRAAALRGPPGAGSARPA